MGSDAESDCRVSTPSLVPSRRAGWGPKSIQESVSTREPSTRSDALKRSVSMTNLASVGQRISGDFTGNAQQAQIVGRAAIRSEASDVGDDRPDVSESSRVRVSSTSITFQCGAQGIRRHAVLTEFSSTRPNSESDSAINETATLDSLGTIGQSVAQFPVPPQPAHPY